MNMDLRDKIILDHAPCIAEPKYGDRWPLAANSHRFLAAEDGLWLELHREWLYLRHQVAVSELPLPYGRVTEYRQMLITEHALHAFILMFINDARDALPNEAAAWVVWDSEEGRPHYRPLIPEHATPGSITYQRPVLGPHESLAVDLHSHGDIPAGWSATDDEDDTGEVKLAVVVGEVNETHPGILIRLCALGLFIDLPAPI